MESDDVASGDCMTGLLQFLSLAVCSCYMTRGGGEIGTKKCACITETRITKNVRFIAYDKYSLKPCYIHRCMAMCLSRCDL